MSFAANHTPKKDYPYHFNNMIEIGSYIIIINMNLMMTSDNVARVARVLMGGQDHFRVIEVTKRDILVSTDLMLANHEQHKARLKCARLMFTHLNDKKVHVPDYDSKMIYIAKQIVEVKLLIAARKAELFSSGKLKEQRAEYLFDMVELKVANIYTRTPIATHADLLQLIKTLLGVKLDSAVEITRLVDLGSREYSRNDKIRYQQIRVLKLKCASALFKTLDHGHCPEAIKKVIKQVNPYLEIIITESEIERLITELRKIEIAEAKAHIRATGPQERKDDEGKVTGNQTVSGVSFLKAKPVKQSAAGSRTVFPSLAKEKILRINVNRP